MAEGITSVSNAQHGTTPLLTAQAVALSPLEKDASSMRRLSHAHWRRWGHVSGLLHRNDATSPVAMSGCWPQARLRREGGRYGARVGYPERRHHERLLATSQATSSRVAPTPSAIRTASRQARLHNIWTHPQEVLQGSRSCPGSRALER